jgi:hypothetical protein
MSTLPLRSIRLALVVAGVAVAAPSFASSVIPLCGDEKHDEKAKNEEKNKSESKKETEKKKPVNQG